MSRCVSFFRSLSCFAAGKRRGPRSAPPTRYHQAPTKKPGDEAAPDRARPRASRFLVENGGLFRRKRSARKRNNQISLWGPVFSSCVVLAGSIIPANHRDKHTPFSGRFATVFFRLRVTGYGLHVTGCGLQVADCGFWRFILSTCHTLSVERFYPYTKTRAGAGKRPV